LQKQLALLTYRWPSVPLQSLKGRRGGWWDKQVPTRLIAEFQYVLPNRAS
jgi:hypothetical protein